MIAPRLCVQEVWACSVSPVTLWRCRLRRLFLGQPPSDSSSMAIRACPARPVCCEKARHVLRYRHALDSHLLLRKCSVAVEALLEATRSPAVLVPVIPAALAEQGPRRTRRLCCQCVNRHIRHHRRPGVRAHDRCNTATITRSRRYRRCVACDLTTCLMWSTLSWAALVLGVWHSSSTSILQQCRISASLPEASSSFVRKSVSCTHKKRTWSLMYP